MAAFPCKQANTPADATEEEDDQRTAPGKERERSGKGDVDSRIMQVEGWRKMEAAAQN